MKTRCGKLALLCGAASLCLQACSWQLPSHEKAVEGTAATRESAPDAWSAEAAARGDVDDGWILDFGDRRLVELVNEAMANNPGLRIAEAQVERANALAQLAGSALKPTVGLGGQVLGTTPGGVSPGTFGVSGGGLDATGLLGGVGISWEADVWGRIRSGATAAERSAAAAAADYAFSRQSLAAATARGWFLAIDSKLQHGFAANVAELRGRMAALVEKKHEVGQVSMKDVHLARANLAQAREAREQAWIAEEKALRSLEVLVGRYPSAELETADRLVAVPPPIPAGVPSTLLERRPDLIAAEERVAAAFYREREAKLLRLPRFSLTGGAGGTNLAGAIAGLAAGVFAPLYTGGAIEAEIRQATAEQKQAVAAYAQQALQAFQEVETALSNEGLLADREAYLQTAVEENGRTSAITEKQFDVGKIDLLEVLIVQNDWIASRITLLDVSTSRLLNRIHLHLALGGSFEPAAGSATPAKADPHA